jgi:hypothetical protein
VEKNEVIAEFRDPDLESEIDKAALQQYEARQHINFLDKKFDQTNDQKEKGEIRKKRAELNDKFEQASSALHSLERIRDEELNLRAPCSGTVGVAPSVDEVTRMFPEDPVTPFITINQPGHVRVCMPIITPDFNRLRQALEQLSPAALGTRRLLNRNVTVSYDNSRLGDVLEDLKKQVKGLQWTLEKNAGALQNLTVSYQAKKLRLGLVLDSLFEEMGLGYIVVSDPDSSRDGHLLIRRGSERGEPREGRPLADLDVIIRVKGHDSQTWKGKIRQLPESEAKTVPLLLSNRQGGPVAVKAGTQADKLVPSTQQYLVYIELVNPDKSLVPGTAAQVKIYCQPETCVHWLWRWLNETFDLGLM